MNDNKRKCKHCSLYFIPTRSDNVFCSKKCGVIHNHPAYTLDKEKKSAYRKKVNEYTKLKRSKGLLSKKEKARELWASMMNRCYNKNQQNYSLYGDRGIIVSDDWHKFDNYYRDMGDRPNEMTIERIDVNKGYSKENCRWATIKEQANNKRDNRIITAFGISKTLAQWSDDSGIKRTTISQRIDYYGWTVERAVSVVKKQNKRINRDQVIYIPEGVSESDQPRKPFNGSESWRERKP